MIFLPKIAAAMNVIQDSRQHYEDLRYGHYERLAEIKRRCYDEQRIENEDFAQHYAELQEWEQSELDALEVWDEPTTK